MAGRVARHLADVHPDAVDEPHPVGHLGAFEADAAGRGRGALAPARDGLPVGAEPDPVEGGPFPLELLADLELASGRLEAGLAGRNGHIDDESLLHALAAVDPGALLAKADFDAGAAGREHRELRVIDENTVLGFCGTLWPAAAAKQATDKTAKGVIDDRPVVRGPGGDATGSPGRGRKVAAERASSDENPVQNAFRPGSNGDGGNLVPHRRRVGSVGDPMAGGAPCGLFLISDASVELVDAAPLRLGGGTPLGPQTAALGGSVPGHFRRLPPSAGRVRLDPGEAEALGIVAVAGTETGAGVASGVGRGTVGGRITRRDRGTVRRAGRERKTAKQGEGELGKVAAWHRESRSELPEVMASSPPSVNRFVLGGAVRSRLGCEMRQPFVHFGTLLAGIFGLALPGGGSALAAAEFADPAPPAYVEAPAASAPSEPSAFPGLLFHAPPKPLAAEAVVSDWPRFLGPQDDASSPETHLLERLPEGGPVRVWEMEKGNSYTSPVAAGGKLVVFNRFGDEEVVQALDPETGRQFWEFRYPVDYRDRYGFNNGPRASAVIAEGRVFVLGVASTLTCLDLAGGTKLWQRQLAEEFDRLPYFFGHGCAPVVHGGRVIVPLGTSDGLSVAAFDVVTGRLAWGTRHEWQAGYASPVVATMRGKPRLLVFAGDDSDPPVGGLLCIDPENGDLHDAFPWRPDKYESVNGSTPVVLDGDRVFVSATYDKGGAMLRLGEDLKWEELWRSPGFGMHWMTPLALDGVLYGYHGRNEPDALLKAVDAASGKELWQADPEWAIPGPGGRDYRMKYFRGSLLRADGRVWALGEFGTLGLVRLTREGLEEIERAQLFVARATWSLPVLHRGLLFVAQHEPDMEGRPPRLICYDLRR